MSTWLHAVFNVVFANVYFVKFFSIFVVEKCNFLKVVKTLCPKNRFLIILRSFFSTYDFFPGWEWFFAVSTLQYKFFKEKMSSLAGLKKKIFNFLIKYRFWPFLTTWVHLQSRFSQRTGKISKNHRSISCGRLLGTLCQILGFLSLLACVGD